MVYHLSGAFYEFVFITISENGPKWTHFAKIAYKIARSRYFLKIYINRNLRRIPFKMVCYVICSQMNGRDVLNHLALLFCKSVHKVRK